MKKLNEIQQKMKAPKSLFNDFGKYSYRSAEDILEAAKPFLGTAVILLTDEIKQAGDLIYVESTATLIHEDQTISTKAQAGIEPKRKGMDLSQCFGSSSSYARKYALNGLLCIDAELIVE